MMEIEGKDDQIQIGRVKNISRRSTEYLSFPLYAQLSIGGGLQRLELYNYYPM